MIAGLPYDAEVEYLARTDGTSAGPYIITDIYGDNSLDFCIKAMCYDYNDRTYFGARRNYEGTDANIYNLVSGAPRGNYTRGRFGFGNHYWFYWPAIKNIAYKVFTAQKVGDTVTSSGGANFSVAGEAEFTTPYPIEIFAMSTATQNRHNQEGLVGRIYYLTFSRNGVLIADFIPVRFTNSNGQSEGAMYDRVSRKLFRNAGTGSFTIGPDVATPVMGLHFMRRPRYTARDYVQTGLIAMWDGEWNEGWGVHNANATVWKDLVGNCHLDDLFVDSAYSPTSGFGDDYWWFTGGMSRWRKQNATITYKTAELVSFQPNEQYTSFCGGSENYNLGGYFGSVVMGSSSSPYPSISRNTDSVSVYSYTIGTEGDSSTYTAYREGSLLSKGVLGAGNNYVADEVAIGTVVRRQLFVTPRIYCVRLYSRALTADEVAHNYAVDKERFNLP